MSSVIRTPRSTNNRYRPYWTPSSATQRALLSSLIRGARSLSEYSRRSSRSSTASRGSTAGISGTSNYTTTQKDSRLQYRHKRAPKKKRRSWGKFVRKVQAVAESEQGTNTIMRNTTKSFVVGALPSFTSQNYFTTCLYGWKGTDANEQGTQDMYSLMDADDRIDITKTQKVKMVNGVMDITITNTGETAIELDIYRVRYTRKSNNTSSITTVMNQSYLQQITPTANVGPGANNGLDIQDRGATLFDVPLFSREVGLKINSKQKFFLPAGDSVTYQIRDPKTHYFQSGDYISENNNFVWPWKTQGIVGIFKTCAGLDINGSVAVGCTRTYKYKILSNSKTYGLNRI